MNQSGSIRLVSPSEGRKTSLFQALKKRRTIREFEDRPLSLKMLSNLLWAADGVNRSSGPFGVIGRTAASASNSQEIDIYVALKEGVFRYEAGEKLLVPVFEGDLRSRALTPGQPRTGVRAPVQLIYAVDIRRLTHTQGFEEPGLHDTEVQKSYYYVDTGLIAGNVYLFAAANGLAAWFHNCDKTLAKTLGLNPEQHVLFAQSVGYPKKRGK